MDSKTLRRLQLTEIDILKTIDDFCRENEIKYTLTAGTALGAVRHGGFIPWDDDIDIGMERTEYERFIKLWREKGVQGFYLQGTDDNSYTSLNHSKIRKDNTVLAGKKEVKQKGHHGIWVDIFPFDKVPKKKSIELYISFVAAIRLVYTRNYPLIGNGKVLEYVSRLMLALPKSIKDKIKQFCDRTVTKYKTCKDNYHVVSFSAPENIRRYYPEDLFDIYTSIKFENYDFMIVLSYKKMLEVLYGDYMKLPPKENQICSHNPEVLLFCEE